jgi:hypothetical protein
MTIKSRAFMERLTVAIGFIFTIYFGADRAFGFDTSQLRGELFIAGEQVVDPMPKSPKNSHAYFTVKGPAALRMYRNMQVREINDLCLPGRKLKHVGSLSCSLAANGREAFCDFSVNLWKGELAGGQPC